MTAVVLQGNLQRCRLAQDLLQQRACELSADLIIVSEQYQYQRVVGPGWFADTSGTAAIWVRNSQKFPIEKSGAGDGYVWITSNRVTYISCYLTPSDDMEAFHTKLANIEEVVRNIGGEIIYCCGRLQRQIS